MIWMKKVTFKRVVTFFVSLVILAAPLIVFHIINMFDMNELQIGIFTIPKLYRYRSDDLVIEDIWKNIVLFFKTVFSVLKKAFKYIGAAKEQEDGIHNS